MGPHAKQGRGLTDTWITPPEIIAALGPFDLDPCAAPKQPWPCATRSYTIADDGLAQPWEGRVWCNPPYGPAVGKWLGRLADNGDGIALVFARTETIWFQAAACRADAILFPARRITFRREDGSVPKFNGGAPSAFLAFGGACVARLYEAKFEGFIVRPRALSKTAHNIPNFLPR